MIILEVVGVPAPQGSHRGFVVPGKDGKKARAVVVTGGSKGGRERLGSWRQDVIDACQRYRALETDYRPSLPLQGPVYVQLQFRLPRPKSAPKQRLWPYVKPDLDRLVRSTGDALKLGGIYMDDAQICRLDAEKAYGEPSGATITIMVMV